MRAWKLTALVALLGMPLMLSLSAPSQARDRERTEAEDEEREEAFEDYTAALDSGNKAAAADALTAMIDDDELEEWHGEAWALMGDLMVNLQLPYSALAAYRQALSADPDTMEAVGKKALDLGDSVGDSAYLSSVFAANVGLAASSDQRSRVAWLGAREAYRQGELATALAALTMVESGSEVYGSSQLMKGVVLSQQSRHSDALPPLLTAASIAETAGDQEMLTLTNLNVARAYYAMGVTTYDREGLGAAAGSFARASEYYSYVPRESHLWPQAQFERAWTHYRLEDLSGALGYLQTHVSPFFTDWYFPEAKMMRIYALFLLCKFPEASDQVEDFKLHYNPVRDEVAPLLMSMGDQAVYADVVAYTRGGEHRLPEMFLRDYKNDERLLATLAAVASADDELQRLASVASSDFSEPIGALIQDRRQELIEREGARMKARMEAMIDDVDGWLQDTDILKLDMLKFETRLYEQAAVTGGFEDPRALARRKLRRAPNQLAWAYEGEHWADELGYYQIDAKPECPASMQAGGN